MENKYQYTDKCREISGFGGDYEVACRKMVIQGMEWMDRNQDADPRFKTLQNVTGICLSVNDDATSLHDAMTAGLEGLTGAMVHHTTNHVMAARKMGWDKYIQEMEYKED